MLIKNIDEKTIAKRIILNSLKIEESLADILKTELKILKRKMKTNMATSNDDIQQVNRTTKHVIYYLIIIEERIQKSLDIIKSNKD